MKTILHILTGPDDALAEKVIGLQQANPDHQIQRIDRGARATTRAVDLVRSNDSTSERQRWHVATWLSNAARTSPSSSP